MARIKSSLATARMIKREFGRSRFQPSQIQSRISFSSNTNNITVEENEVRVISRMSKDVGTAFDYVKRDANHIEKLAITFDNEDKSIKDSIDEYMGGRHGKK